MIIDIEGNELNIGDEVYVPRSVMYYSCGNLVTGTIIEFNKLGHAIIDKQMISEQPHLQLLKKR